MRTIKFKGKTLRASGMLPAGSWVEGGYYRDDCYGGCPEGKHYIIQWNSAGPGGYTQLIEVDGETVGQLVGIGKLSIWEKDIFEYARLSSLHDDQPVYERGVIEYSENGEWVVNGLLLCRILHRGKAIGNLIDNPDLLEAPYAGQG